MHAHNLTYKKAKRIAKLIIQHKLTTLKMLFPKQTTISEYTSQDRKQTESIEPWHTFRDRS